jgi:hypothetical protein
MDVDDPRVLDDTGVEAAPKHNYRLDPNGRVSGGRKWSTANERSGAGTACCAAATFLAATSSGAQMSIGC